MRRTLILLAASLLGPVFLAPVFLGKGAHAQPAIPRQYPARAIPARILPVPGDVSPQLEHLIAAPLNPIASEVPQTAAAWRA